MGFDFEMTANPAKALEAAHKVEASLATIETKARATGQAIEAGVGGKALTDAQGKFVATSVAADQAAKSVTKLSDAENAEAKMLEKIRGPLRDLEADQRTLNALHEKGILNAKEYETQLAKLAERQEQLSKTGGEHGKGLEIEGSFGKAIAGKGGEIGELVGGLGKGTLVAGAAVGVVAELVKMNDEYTKLQQSALRLVPSIDQVSGAIDKQAQVSRDIHASLEQTIELAVQVKEAVEELGVSELGQIEIERGLGAGAVLSGRSIAAAGEAFRALTFNMESGRPAARQMSQFLRDFPVLADALRESLGKSNREILAMAKAGTLTVDQITNAIESKSADLVAKASKVPETLNQKWDHFKDRAINGVGSIVNAVEKANPILNIKTLIDGKPLIGDSAGDERVNAYYRKFWEDAGFVQEEGESKMLASLQKWRVDFDVQLREQSTNTKQIAHDLFANIPNELDGALDRLKGLGMQLGIVKDPWEALKDPTAAEAIRRNANKIGADTAAAVGKAKLEIKALEQAHKDGTVTGEKYRAMHEALLTTIEGGVSAYRRVFNEINDPVRKYKEDIAALNALHANGAITALQFEGALDRLKSPGFADLEVVIRRDSAALDEFYAKMRTNMELAKRGGEPLLEAAPSMTAGDVFQLHEINRQKELEVAEAKREDAAATKGLDDFEKEWIKTQEKSAQMADKVATVMKAGNKSMVRDTAALAREITSTLAPINAAFMDMIEGRKVNWKQMIDSMISDAGRLALKLLEEKAIIALLQPKTTGVLGALGGGGGGEGGGFASALEGILGNLPGHAIGGSWTVPGSGTGDRTLQAFWGTPGETITATPPGAGSRSSGREAPSYNSRTILHYDPRALLDTVDTDAGGRTMVSRIRANPNAIRSILR